MLTRSCTFLVMLILFAALPCCNSKTLRVTSVSSGSTLTTTFPTRVFRSSDRNTVDFFLTDLPPELWREGADFSGVSGTLVHLHMFIAPEAGKTPMEDTASNLTLRYLICSRGEFGLYAGGGFLLGDGDPADRHFGGDVSRASLRLIRRSAGFRDLLGAAELSGDFEGVNDPSGAGVLAERLRSITESLPEVPKSPTGANTSPSAPKAGGTKEGTGR